MTKIQTDKTAPSNNRYVTKMFRSLDFRIWILFGIWILRFEILNYSLVEIA